MKTAERYDVIIVGGGMAGLSAALVLARARRRVVVLDSGAPRNAVAEHVQGLLTRDRTAPAELLRLARTEVANYGAEIRQATVVASSGRRGDFEAVLEDGVPLRGRRLLVATGLQDHLPEVEGLAGRWGRDVHHCPYCHGYEVCGQRITLLGCSAHDAHEALLLRQWTEHVVLVLPDVDLVPDHDRARLVARGVDLVEGAAHRLCVEDDAVTGVELADGRLLSTRFVFVGPRFTSNDHLLRSLGAVSDRTDLGDFVQTDATGATSVPGVWATGNVTSPQELVVDAAAAGSRAAIALNMDLVLADADAAVAGEARAGRR